MPKTMPPPTDAPKPARKTATASKKSPSKAAAPEPAVIRVGPKGVITIPDKYRQALQLEPGKYVTLTLVGNQLVVSADINAFLTIAGEAQQILAEQGISPETVLQSQIQARKRLHQELYPEKQQNV